MSESCKILVVVELTVPYETNMSQSHEYKLAKYEELMISLHRGGFVTHFFLSGSWPQTSRAACVEVLRRLNMCCQHAKRP